MTLSGANTYTGITTINAGTLQIGNAGTTGTLGTGNVTDNAALTFNLTNSITVANAIGGTGSVSQIGSGTTTLLAANTYSGTTTINAGTLEVDGSIYSSAATVNSGGILDGKGILAQST